MGKKTERNGNLVCWICNELSVTARNLCLHRGNIYQKVKFHQNCQSRQHEEEEDEEEEQKANVYFVTPPALPPLLSSTSALICGHLPAPGTKLLFILFCGCQNPSLPLNAPGLGGGGRRCAGGGDRSPKSAADTTLSPKDPPLEKKKKIKSPPVIVKISINGKSLTRSRGYQIGQT